MDFKPDCLKCIQFQKRYCIGTFNNEKGLICAKKITNGMKYRNIKKSKKGY